MINAPLLVLPNFSKTFKVKYDASNVGVGVVLLKEGQPITYYGEKLRGSHINDSIYDKELYDLVKIFQIWHYLFSKEFMIHNYLESLNFKSQGT